MALMKLAQISGGLGLQKDVAALKASYEAAKVLTTIAKTGDNAGVYNVQEVLDQLRENVKAITGNDSQDTTSLTSLKKAIDTINSKKFQDAVRIEMAVANNVATVPTNLATLVPGVDTSKLLPVYTEDNDILYNEKGEQLTVNLATGAFNGTPSTLDAEASAASADGSKVYKAVTLTKVKVFPVGTYSFSDVPEGAALDNEELQLLAYKNALNDIVVQLAKDKTLIEQVKALIGTEAVQDQLTTQKTKIDEEISANKKLIDTNTAAIAKETTDRTAAIEQEVKNRDAAIKTAVDAATTTAQTNLDNAKTELTKAISDAKTEAEGKVTEEATRAQAAEKVNADAITALDKRVTTIEGAEELQATDKVDVTSETAVTTFALTQTPTAELVTMFINGVVYFEGVDFTVDRSAKSVTWTATDLTIDKTLCSAVFFQYHYLHKAEAAQA